MGTATPEWTKGESSASLASLFNEECFTCGGHPVVDELTDCGWVTVTCQDCGGSGLSENAKEARAELWRRIRANRVRRAKAVA